jgi:single-strand DNA-binding protein
MNKAQLIGHVGKDPEIRSLQDGGKVCSFSVATSEAWKDKKSGERKERTEWHRVTVFSPGLVGIAEKYIRKGSKVYVEGQLATRKWTDAKGHENHTTEIVLKGFGGTIELLDRKPAETAPATAGGADAFDDIYEGALEEEIVF